MRTISLKPLREFWKKHADAEAQLRAWYKTAINAEWTNFRDVRRIYPDADAVSANDDTLLVFDICGGSYRLVVRVRYDHQLLNVRCVLTHKEYDKGKWKE